MLTVICVLRSGGVYDADWVRKLKAGAEKHIPKHRFVCLSDVEVPCERINLIRDWPGWWSKIELFREGVIDGPTLYLDLDTIIVGKVEILRSGVDFAMLQSFWKPDMVGSGVMYFSGNNVPHRIFHKFAKQPKAWIAHHERNAWKCRQGTYVGDQAFIWDAMNHDVARVNDYVPGIVSYKLQCQNGIPKDASIVCFHGQPRPTEVKDAWVKENWS